MKLTLGWLAALWLAGTVAATGFPRPPQAAPRTGRAVGWRGDGTGRYPDAAPPSQWDVDEGTNILWRAAVGKSHSSPIAVGGRIFLTAEKDLLLCVDRAGGKVLWKRNSGFSLLPPVARAAARRRPVGPGGGYSMPTPVADGSCVYACHGTGIVACYDARGNRKWFRYFDLPQATEFGRSASPLLVKGKLLVSIGGLIALDPRTGRTLWQTKRPKCSYGTPAVAAIGNVDVVITPNGDCVRVSDGRVLAKGLGCAKHSSPVVHGGVVYFADAPAMAVRLPARAGESIQPARLWQADELEGEFFASPVCHAGILYCVSNEGVLYALDAGTGKTVFRKELDIPSASGAPGMEAANVYPSLTLVGKHLLLANDAGQTLVLLPGRKYRQVACNYLDAGSGASPVADGKLLFLRGGGRLYCIGRK